MSKPEAKFSVGQRVMIRSLSAPERNHNNAIVVESFYGLRTPMPSGKESVGWAYRTNTCSRNGPYLYESALKSRPEPATASYGELIASIKAIKPSKVKGEYMSSLVDFYLREIDQDANN